jgi:DNA topoisomerase-3
MIAIIAEKSSVAKDIARVLGVRKNMDGYMEGSGYLITWAFGHLAVLAPPESYGATKIPVIPDVFKLVSRREKTVNGYEPDKSALKQLKVIKSVFDRCDRIIVATDSAREGELIFRNIYKLLDCDKPFERLWISSLTDKAISEGLKNLKPGRDYDSLYLVAEARSCADWLVGLNASRALAAVTGDGNSSLGRVQTPTLAMVCARYEENRNFKPAPYWVFKAGIEKDGEIFHLTAREKAYDKATAETLYKKLSSDKSIRITEVERKDVRQEPPLLYDLTALQKDANSRHGFSAEQTLNIAQKLYEAKLASYPRTGSRYIPEDIFAEIPALIAGLCRHPQFGKYASEMDTEQLNGRSVDNQKITDHHALIVTENAAGKLSPDEQTVYDMIAGRMLEAFSPVCVKDVLTIRAESGSGMAFETKGSTIRKAGWRGVFSMEEEKAEDEESRPLPALSEGEAFIMPCCNMVQRRTKPKPLYTEATLLAAMERAGGKPNDGQEHETAAAPGIGTPATRAGIIETLFRRGYMERDGRNLIPAGKGLQLYQVVRSLRIADAALTGEWEGKLSAIEKNPSFRNAFMDEIREYTRKVVDEISGVEIQVNDRKLPCPKCKSGAITIYNKVAKCDNVSCNLTVFKSVCGKNLTDSQMAGLLKNGKTEIIRGFKSKQDNSFDASLKFADDFSIAFEFAKTAATGKTAKANRNRLGKR